MPASDTILFLSYFVSQQNPPTMALTSKSTYHFVLIAIATLLPTRCLSFQPISSLGICDRRRSKTPLSASPSPLSPPPIESVSEGQLTRARALASQSRRTLVTKAITSSLGFLSIFSVPKNDDKALAADLNELVGQLKQARDQLNEVPDLIKAEKWDSGKDFS